MPDHLRLFGLVHLIILADVPLIAAVLAAVQRRLAPGARGIRYGLATLLFLCFVLYYGYFALQGQRMFPNHVPLELCDASLWLVIVALLTLKPVVFDLAYYYALAGASMSLLTPVLTESFPLFLSIQYFCDHGLIVVSVLYLVWTRQARPRTGSVGRAMLALNIYAVFVGAFDAFYKTNYMYLRAKPQTDSLLTIFGPWPWYILVSEPAGLALFLLLYLPFRQRPIPATAQKP